MRSCRRELYESCFLYTLGVDAHACHSSRKVEEAAYDQPNRMTSTQNPRPSWSRYNNQQVVGCRVPVSPRLVKGSALRYSTSSTQARRVECAQTLLHARSSVTKFATEIQTRSAVSLSSRASSFRPFRSPSQVVLFSRSATGSPKWLRFSAFAGAIGGVAFDARTRRARRSNHGSRFAGLESPMPERNPCPRNRSQLPLWRPMALGYAERNLPTEPVTVSSSPRRRRSSPPTLDEPPRLQRNQESTVGIPTRGPVPATVDCCRQAFKVEGATVDCRKPAVTTRSQQQSTIVWLVSGLTFQPSMVPKPTSMGLEEPSTLVSSPSKSREQPSTVGFSQ